MLKKLKDNPLVGAVWKKLKDNPLVGAIFWIAIGLTYTILPDPLPIVVDDLLVDFIAIRRTAALMKLKKAGVQKLDEVTGGRAEQTINALENSKKAAKAFKSGNLGNMVVEKTTTDLKEKVNSKEVTKLDDITIFK